MPIFYAPVTSKIDPEVLTKVLDWFIDQIHFEEFEKGESLSNESLSDFRKKLSNHIKDRYYSFGSCNLRTTNPDKDKLCEIAGEAGIPNDFLPKNLSLIINEYGKVFYTLGLNPKIFL